MPSHIDSTYLCELTAAQIQEILVLKGVSIQQYQPQLHRWLTIVQLPDLGQLTLDLEPEKAAEIDRRLQNREIIEFTSATTVMNINICDRYAFVPLLEQPGWCGIDDTDLWGRMCLRGNSQSKWSPQDLSWVQALGQQLLATIHFISEVEVERDSRSSSLNSTGSSPLEDLAELIERITELEAVCQQKDEFIDRISHDLRAPITNIKMAMRMLDNSLREDPQISRLLAGHRAEKYLSLLERECDREIGAIDNILDVQKLERSNQQLEIESVEIATWLPATIAPFQHRARTSGRKLITSVPSHISQIATDREALTKIFTELLHNACKYTDLEGQIVVSIDEDVSSEWLTIVVKNQAEISAQHLPSLFDRFYRIPGSDRFGQGGTGLGLSLVQKLVEQLNGEINVASKDGWTEFSIKLPVVKLPVQLNR